MTRKRHKPEEIVAKLRQVDVLVSQGQAVADAIRAIGVTEVGSETSCLTASSSTHSERLRSSWRAGGDTTIRSGLMPHSATGRRLQRCSCPPCPHGRLSNSSHQRRRPGWRKGHHSINIPTGPLHGGGSIERPACESSQPISLN